MSKSQLSQGELIRLVISRFLPMILLLAAMFFIPAGTLAYREAWVYLTILVVPMIFVLIYLLKNDPGLLERRMHMREKEAQQKLIVKLTYIPFILAFMLPGFDKRFGWSDVPLGIVIAADVLVVLGYGIIFLVFRENSYASRIVEVEQEQTVIQSGPYAIVRHPMYVGVIILYTLTPLALGSWWAAIPIVLVVIPAIVARIFDEERLLIKGLKGYLEYVEKVRYRLIPGIW